LDVVVGSEIKDESTILTEGCHMMAKNTFGHCSDRCARTGHHGDLRTHDGYGSYVGTQLLLTISIICFSTVF